MHDPIKFTIRSATPEDASAVSTLILSLTEFVVEDSERENASEFFETLGVEATVQRIKSGDYRYFVCEDGGVLCGVIGLKEKTHIYHLFVKADCHQQGIARKLWDYARADVDGRVFTVNSSAFAIPVYRRLGFVQAGEVTRQDGLEFMPMEYAGDPPG